MRKSAWYTWAIFPPESSNCGVNMGDPLLMPVQDSPLGLEWPGK